MSGAHQDTSNFSHLQHAIFNSSPLENFTKFDVKIKRLIEDFFSTAKEMHYHKTHGGLKNGREIHYSKLICTNLKRKMAEIAQRKQKP